MASITKAKNGYRAQVYVRGTRASAVCRTKREAEAWSAYSWDGSTGIAGFLEVQGHAGQHGLAGLVGCARLKG